MRYVLALMMGEETAVIQTASNRFFEVIFEDKHLIVLNKAPGIMSQEDGSDAPSLVKELSKSWGRPYVGVVHRLDRNTSGLMVYAKRTKAASRLAEYLRQGLLKRKYRAIAWGSVPEGTLDWRDLLLKDEDKNIVRVLRSLPVEGKSPALAKEAIMKITKIEELNELSLVECELETGRSHQIRVQCASRNFPLLGDAKYDKSFENRKIKFLRPALHSSFLQFPHPMDTSNVLKFEKLWSNDLSQMWKKLSC